MKIVRTNVNFYGGASGSNCASSPQSITGAGVVIRHKMSNGEEFDVLYAHLKNLTVNIVDEGEDLEIPAFIRRKMKK